MTGNDKSGGKSALHEGHRQRMTKRLENSPNSLSDHELLEILLFNIIPRRNTNETAHSLLDAFGSFSGMFHAEKDQLTEIEGVGESTAEYLRCIGLCMDQIRQSKMDTPSIVNYESFCGFVRERFADVKTERIELYKFDGRDHIGYAQSYAIEGTDRIGAAMDSLGRFLAISCPRAVLIVHNRMNGRATPSKEDDRLTEQVQMLCAMHGVKFYDHMIIGSDRIFSYFWSGHLAKIRKDFTMQAIFDNN